MDMIDAIHGRRSIRRFRTDPVPRPLIEALILDAACAPFTPMSPPDPWVFTVVEGRARITSYGERALDFVRSHRPQRDGYGWADDPHFSVFHAAPAIIIISGASTNPLGLEECTRAGQILTLSAHARGLGSCWVGSPNLWLRDPRVRLELGIPEGFTPHAVFAIGFPAPPLPTRTALPLPRITWLDQHEPPLTPDERVP